MPEDGMPNDETNDSQDQEEKLKPEVRASIGTQPYRVQITSGRHLLTADEPRNNGGEDAGPDPYAYLLSALGSCKAITVRMYAERKEWPLEEVRVDLEHDRIHAEDCADCESEEGKVDRIRVALAFDGNLSSEQRERLREIAGMCPVHRTLTSEIVIETSPLPE